MLFDEDASWAWDNDSEAEIQAPSDDVHESGGTQLSTRQTSHESREGTPTITPKNLTPSRSSTQRTFDINTLTDDSPP